MEGWGPTGAPWKLWPFWWGILGERSMSIAFQNIKTGRGVLWTGVTLGITVNNGRTQVLSSISPNPENINYIHTEVHSGEPRHHSFCLLARIILAHSGHTGYLVMI